MNVRTFNEHTRDFIESVGRGDLEGARQLLAIHREIVTDRNVCEETALHWLVMEGKLEGVRLLLKHGADPDAKSYSGNWSLADAASLDHAEIVRILLDAGANVNQRHDHNQETALHVAARHSKVPEIADLLLDAGAEIEARTNLAETPLHCAARVDNRGFAARLLARGADASAVDEMAQTFVDVAPEDKRTAWQEMMDRAMANRRGEE